MKRALIIKKEWLDKIFYNDKTIEMRSRPVIKIRGIIGLIEAGSGLIMGEADLYYCYGPMSEYKFYKFQDRHQLEDINMLKKWPFAWCLRDVKKYEKPIPYKHPKGAVVWVKLED
jgi:hypothetical protein